MSGGTPFDPRYLRQVILTEVGAAGQQRIGRARLAVAGVGLAHEVAERYARAAGAVDIAPGAIDVEALAPREIAAEPAAREVLAGSRAALFGLLAAVREEP